MDSKTKKKTAAQAADKLAHFPTWKTLSVDMSETNDSLREWIQKNGTGVKPVVLEYLKVRVPGEGVVETRYVAVKVSDLCPNDSYPRWTAPRRAGLNVGLQALTFEDVFALARELHKGEKEVLQGEEEVFHIAMAMKEEIESYLDKSTLPVNCFSHQLGRLAIGRFEKQLSVGAQGTSGISPRTLMIFKH